MNLYCYSAALFQCDYICIGTNGKSKAIIGTTASKLIVASPVPVVSIPSTRSSKKLTQVCYASNMVNYQKEIRKVITFAEPLDASIIMLHIVNAKENLPKAIAIETKLLKKTERIVKVKYLKRNLEQTLCDDINTAVKKIKPGLMVFFIHRSQPYWNAMFHPSNIKPFSFYAKIPILSFKK
ncbi:universal stress protein [Pedobacter agri]|uniref:Universal stress protein n=1 Tax=Pedobacter agri TaxID=454586 RepID=A0A9X3DDQ8_9SPHI|nr:universal stress protein [Pedobacter agri]MCX3265295.1 universal stress protein [Pedobacter agri]